MIARTLKLAGAHLLPNLHCRVAGCRREIFLSFDDGPHANTPALLDVLDRHGVRATFFVLGNRIEGKQAVLEAIAERGHAIGSHSHTHRSARRLAPAELRQEQDQCVAAIRRVLPNWDSDLVRPPYGHITPQYWRWARRTRRQIILWSRDALDYRAGSTEEVERNLGALRGGDILLFHDQFPVTAQTLERLIPTYLERGYRFSSLAVLSQSAAPECRRQHWQDQDTGSPAVD